VPVLEGIEELFYGAVLEGIDRDDLGMGKDDADGDRDIIGVAFVEGVVFSGCFDDNELYVVLVFEAGSFIDVQGVGKKVEGDAQFIGKIAELQLFEGRQDIHPRCVFGVVDFYGLVVDVLKKLDHGLIWDGSVD
jgi:hypothetical protein